VRRAPGLALLLALAALGGSLALAPLPTSAQAPPRIAPLPLPLISRELPAFASEGSDPPGLANDADYATSWRSGSLPAWLAYDLSSLPAARRGRVVLVWYNADTLPYDAALRRENRSFLPRAYTIEANPAPGGVVPAAGWVGLTGVTDNSYHSRQHVVDLTGYNWLRLVLSEASRPDQVRLNLDLHDAQWGLADSWIFYGDSITAAAMQVAPIGSTGTFAQLVNLRVPSSFPIQEGGGINSLTSGDGAEALPTWLAAFPGRYVGLSYGTNDANRDLSPEAFTANYEAMVQAALAAGKVPVVPKIPWARRPNVQRNGPLLNARLEQLYAAYPEIVRGPDFWAYYLQHHGLISDDDLHPTEAGYAAYRELWADAMAARVYSGGK
jgi:lysophospholipase L1-like esterase